MESYLWMLKGINETIDAFILRLGALDMTKKVFVFLIYILYILYK